MNSSERFAAAAKHILDEDRRADRERIAELERDLAALVVENKRLREDDEPERKPLDVAAMNRALDECGVPPVKQEPTLRIDTDMSDPQPGKLLVVRLDEGNARLMQNPFISFKFCRDQFVGFLVETPAVKRTPQVGDKVRIIKQGFNFIPAWGQVGEVGTVRSVDCDSVWLDGVGTGGSWCHDINNLEVIE